MNRLIAKLALLLVVTLPGAAGGAEQLDLSDWRALPVLHSGRRMPLDTFANLAVDTVCDRENPTLQLQGAVPKQDLESDQYAKAKELFPDGKPRKFRAAELLLSWLTEPDKWEDVPFLICMNEDLRKRLELPIALGDKEGGDGSSLRFVSPREVADSKAFQDVLAEVSQEQRAARQAGEEYRPAGVNNAAMELFRAHALFRQITFNPSVVVFEQRTALVRSKFAEKFDELAGVWQKAGGNLLVFQQHEGIGPSVKRMQESLEKLAEAGRAGEAPLADVEPSVAAIAQATRELARYLARARDSAFRESDAGNEHNTAELRKNFRELASDVDQLARLAHGMHRALYDNGEALCVVPAMTPEALEKDRADDNDARPWLSLQSVLYGSRSLLADYSPAQVDQVRSAWTALARAYGQHRASGRAEQVALGAKGLGKSLAALGNSIEQDRRQLVSDKAKRDVDQLDYTAYPPSDYTATEVLYNRVQPFQWSWVISLLATVCFALSFGVLKKPLYWTGWAVVALGLAWTFYGFYLRVSITRWAPITNMYETVIYVPTFLTLLGAWFAMLPLTWGGVKLAWRMSGIPGTWEAPEPGPEERRLLSAETWPIVGWLMLAPRLALMVGVVYVLAIAPYAAAGQPIINLLPTVDVKSGWPDANDLLTWAVGMLVLIPSVWYLPRVAIAAAASLVTVPSSLSGRVASALPQVYARWPFALAAAAVATFFYMVAWFAPMSGALDENFNPLQPVLRDNFWLVIHVTTIVSSYGAGMLAWGLALIAKSYYLFGTYRTEGAGTIAARKVPPAACGALAAYLYKTVQVAVLLLVAGTILGGLWADVSWGRFWGWDPKEVWALISLLVYLAILHGRYAGWVGNFGLVGCSILGFCAIAFSWYGVNFILPIFSDGKAVGLHSYGFGAGGVGWVCGFVALNLVFTLAASVRYNAEVSAGQQPGAAETEDQAPLDEPVEQE